jgi:hypothetical protein
MFHVNQRAIFKYIGSLVISEGFLLKHCWWIVYELGFLKVKSWGFQITFNYSRWKKNLIINVINEPSSNLRHVSQYARSKEKFEMHVHIVHGINYHDGNLGYIIQCFVSWQRLWQVQQEKAWRVFLKGFKHHLVLHAACYRFLNTDNKHDNKEPCSCKIWQHGQKRYRNIMQPVLTIETHTCMTTWTLTSRKSFEFHTFKTKCV